MTHPDDTDEPAGPAAEPHGVLRSPFPFARLAYAIGFAIVAWVVFWLVLLLALLQFVTTAVTGHVNEELKHFSRSVVLYLQELLLYAIFVQEDRPFPFGPFPKG